jgi:hypothetical protein
MVMESTITHANRPEQAATLITIALGKLLTNLVLFQVKPLSVGAEVV